MKKILHGILNFFKMLFAAFTSPFIKNKKDNTETVTIKSEKIQTIKKNTNKPTGTDTTSLPDEDNMKSNPHDEIIDDGETESTRIYSLPRDLNKMLKVNEKYSYLAFSDEEIDEFINEELEDVYKDENLKIYKVNSVLKKTIDKFKEEIVPIIKDKIYYNNIVSDKKLKKEIKEIVALQLEITPIFPKEEVKEDRPPIILPRKKGVDAPILPLKRDIEEKEVKEEDKPVKEEKHEEIPQMVVKHDEVAPAPTVISELPKLAAAVAITAAKETVDIVSAPFDLPVLKGNTKKEEVPVEETKKPTKKEEPKEEIIEEEEKDPVKAAIIEETVESIEKETTEIIEDVEKIEEEVTIREDDQKERQKEEEVIEEEKPQEKEETPKDENPTLIIPFNDIEVYKRIEEAKKEANKHDFFDKDYDKEEKRIDDMLDKISDTRIKYGNKLTKEQKDKLDNQEKSLRSAKEKLIDAKERDIAFEKKELDTSIKEVELNGLQEEIRKMHLDYDMETNDNLLKKMDKLEGITKEKVKNLDRQMMIKRFNKASILLEMTSLLALPFVRNKYFNYFTIGLIVDNHLGLTNAWLNRKSKRYQPIDMEKIKKGQDALDNALDLAYKDMIELDYIEEQALSRYPELKDDEAYQESISRIRNNLNKQYNKLMKKQTTMEKLMNKGKRQKKVLEKN